MIQPLAFVIEDDMRLSEIFCEAVKMAGYEPQAIHDGQVAMERLQSETPHLVVLDLHLPNVPGTRILSHIREVERLRDVKVIVASADGYLASTFEVDEAATLVVQKPVRFRQLRSLAERLHPEWGNGRSATP